METNTMHPELEDVKVGDLVQLHYNGQLNDDEHYVHVTKVTRTMISCANKRFNRVTGLSVGHGRDSNKDKITRMKK